MNTRHIVLPFYFAITGAITFFVVGSLLQEAHVTEEKAPPVDVNDSKHRHQHDDAGHSADKGSDERQLLSRYGIWLLVELCKPNELSSIVSVFLCTI